MKYIAFIAVFCFLGIFPAAGHEFCGHHGPHCEDCADCGNCRQQGAVGQSRATTASAGQTTLEGKIGEIVYLPGATQEAGMAEIRLQTATQTNTVRLAPVGFLRQGGVLLKEGETVTIKGFAVAAMNGDVIVAPEIRKGDKTLSLRSNRGKSEW